MDNLITDIIVNKSQRDYEKEFNYKSFADEIAKGEFKVFKSKKYSGPGIIEVVKKYGLDVDGKNNLLCPFHSDGKPSLKLYPKTNSFFCFGCRTGGDTITFIKLMEEMYGKKRS